MNIPIYRAKRIAIDEYVIGYLKESFLGANEALFIQTKEWLDYAIDVTTLSIHFEDMLDSQGNRIFASLSEGVTGGDILEHANILTKDKILLIASYHKAKGEFGAYSDTRYIRSMKFHLTKIVGVQK